MFSSGFLAARVRIESRLFTQIVGCALMLAPIRTTEAQLVRLAIVVRDMTPSLLLDDARAKLKDALTAAASRLEQLRGSAGERTAVVNDAINKAERELAKLAAATDALAPSAKFATNACGGEHGYDLFHSGNVAFLGDGGATISAEVTHLCIGNPRGFAVPFVASTASRAFAKGSAAAARVNALSILDIGSGTFGFQAAPAVHSGTTSILTFGALLGGRQNAMVGDSVKGIPDRSVNILDYGAFLRLQTAAWQTDIGPAKEGTFWLQATMLGVSSERDVLRSAGLTNSTGQERGWAAELGVDVKDLVTVRGTYLKASTDGLSAALKGSGVRVQASFSQKKQ